MSDKRCSTDDARAGDGNSGKNDVQGLEELIQMARDLGASAVGVVDAATVPTMDSLAKLCGETPCGAYGLGHN